MSRVYSYKEKETTGILAFIRIKNRAREEP